MTPRERILSALSFQETDRTPIDMGAMRSTGISCFAYPHLVEALGLPPRRPLVHDTGQMLALPELDVLDALGCDVVTIDGGVTNAYNEPEKWHEYDFGGRLDAMVQSPAAFKTRPDGTVVQGNWSEMPPSSSVFNAPHSGQPLLDLNADLPLLDLKQYEAELKNREVTDAQAQAAAAMARRVRSSTDRAVFMTDYCGAGIGIGGYCGIGIFPMICMLEPQFVQDFHEITIEHAIKTARAVLPEVRGQVDILMTGCDDWGTQESLMASPDIYTSLFLPYYRRFNAEVHSLVPGAKLFLHCCGAVYELLDLLVESGFDIINPFQWSAGGHSYTEWKDRVRGRATLWGGGIDAQHTLPHGKIAAVAAESKAISRYCRKDGGYVFNNTHNLLAEVDAHKVIAMYRAAAEA